MTKKKSTAFAGNATTKESAENAFWKTFAKTAWMPLPKPPMDEGVKIPVISTEDVPKIMKELPSVEENPILKAVKEMEK